MLKDDNVSERRVAEIINKDWAFSEIYLHVKAKHEGAEEGIGSGHDHEEFFKYVSSPFHNL